MDGYIPYFDEITDGDTGFVYSCDMIRIHFKYDYRYGDDIGNYLSHRAEFFTAQGPYTNTRPLKYRTLIAITYSEESTVKFGLGLNEFKGTVSRCSFLEFNPNKVFSSKHNPNWKEAMKDIAYVMDRSGSFEVRRFDVAVDMPRKRNEVDIFRGHRSYSRYEPLKRVEDGCVIESEDDYTQYVGKRDTAGRCKVYNKKAERKLKDDWTRVEYTTDKAFFDSEKTDFPEVWYHADNYQMNLSDIDLSERDKMLVEFLSGMDCKEEYLNRLPYRFRAKIKPFVMTGYKRLEVKHNEYIKYIIAQANEYVNGFPDRYRHMLGEDIGRETEAETILYKRSNYLKHFGKHKDITDTDGKVKTVWWSPFEFSTKELITMTDKAFYQGVVFYLKVAGWSDTALSEIRVPDTRVLREALESKQHNADVELTPFTVCMANEVLHEVGCTPNEKALNGHLDAYGGFIEMTDTEIQELLTDIGWV